jgi:hypothetical protein
MSALRALGAALVLLACSCGSSPPPKAPDPESPPPPVDHGPHLSVQGELGEIDQDATEKTFRGLQPDLMQCYKQGQKRVEYLSGDVKFFLRVGPDGGAKWAFLEQSTLGDRLTERCMVTAIVDARWPQPTGGEAEVHKEIGFDPPSNVRKAVDWSPERVTATLGKHGADASGCKAGASGDFKVTAYIEPHGKGGKVQAVGVAPPAKDNDDKVDCIVDAVKKMKMPSPGSYPAKVSFTL